jgi:hypothetical protein
VPNSGIQQRVMLLRPQFGATEAPRAKSTSRL